MLLIRDSQELIFWGSTQLVPFIFVITPRPFMCVWLLLRVFRFLFSCLVLFLFLLFLLFVVCRFRDLDLFCLAFEVFFCLLFYFLFVAFRNFDPYLFFIVFSVVFVFDSCLYFSLRFIQILGRDEGFILFFISFVYFNFKFLFVKWKCDMEMQCKVKLT